MLTSSPNLPHKSLKIKLPLDDGNNNNNNNLFSKHLTTSQSSMALEDDHGGSSAAVPFTWESRPGTPKIKFRENPLPPLTPPPSYFYTTAKTPTKKSYSLSNPFNTIFSKRSARRTSFPLSPASSSSSSSSQFSSPRCSSKPYFFASSSPVTVLRSRVRHEISSPRRSFDSIMMGEEEEHDGGLPVSSMCFGIGRGGNAGRSRGGCYASVIKVLLRDV
ncbi:hypothetical protein MANES_18G140500v8 [Manihot esculenta]|uniref:Uncharacterized protein n=1 Tax=Manihot esculenta TaxID=3983 RepID=A0A2C9U4E8_MANES|nr:hypothetical protein MANES_18G140500v8 [Manihot esculenta]